MITITEDKPLVERIPEFIERLQELQPFYDHNEELLDIYEGNLLPYVEKLMEETLDAKYYTHIKHRILPINFTQKITDKLAKSYAESPIRTSEDQDFIDDMVSALDLDEKGMLAEEYSHLNRGYAYKPKLTNKGKLKLDVMAMDSFLVLADDKSDKQSPTVFIEFLGKMERSIIVKGKEEVKAVDCFIAYSDTEIIGFDMGGSQILEIAEDINYLNPIGAIPFVYGNRSVSNIMPKQDTDFLKLSKILPLMLSDINGAIMFQCFTLIYGIDIEFKDAKMNPNAIWDLSSKPKSDKTGTVGTLQPSVDSDKALNWFKNILAMWLDSKGIDAGSIMQLDSQDMASGLSKLMDQVDTTEARKKSIGKLQKEEKELFILLAKMNNYWFKLPESRDLGLKIVNVEAIEDSINIEFKEPVPKFDTTTEINNSVEMLNNGLTYKEKEIKRLHPHISDEEINQIFFESGEKRNEIGDSKVAEEVKLKDEDISSNEPDIEPVVETDVDADLIINPDEESDKNQE